MLTGRTILPLNGQKEVFLNIGEIYALNFDLLQELEDRIQNWYANTVYSFCMAVCIYVYSSTSPCMSLLGTYEYTSSFLVTHCTLCVCVCRDSSPTIADVIAKRAPFFKVGGWKD